MIGAIILGLVAGFVARAVMPGKDDMGLLADTGDSVSSARWSASTSSPPSASATTTAFDLGGLIGAVIGALIVLALYNKFAKDRVGRAGPTSRTPSRQ